MSNVLHVVSDTWQCCVLYGILEKSLQFGGVWAVFQAVFVFNWGPILGGFFFSAHRGPVFVLEA